MANVSVDEIMMLLGEREVQLFGMRKDLQEATAEIDKLRSMLDEINKTTKETSSGIDRPRGISDRVAEFPQPIVDNQSTDTGIPGPAN